MPSRPALPLLAAALAAAFLLAVPASAGGAQSPAQRLGALAERGDLEALALELASLDLDSVGAKERVPLADALARAAVLAGSRGDHSKAVFCARRAAELRPEAGRFALQARLARAGGDERAEAEALEETLRVAGDDLGALRRLAELREEADPGAALALWRRALANGGDAGVQAAVARCERRVKAAAATDRPTRPGTEAGSSNAASARPTRPGAEAGSSNAASARPTRPGAEAGSSNVARAPQTGDPFKLVYSDKGGYFPNREYGLKVVEILERIRAFVCPRMGRCSDETVVVKLFTSQEYDEQFAGRALGKRAGFFDGAINVSWAQQMSASLEEVLAHEFVHQALRARRLPVPAWLNEGLATYWQGLFAGTGGGRSGFVPTVVCLGIAARHAPRLSRLASGYPWSGSFAESRPGYDYSCAVARYLDGRGPGTISDLLDRLEAKTKLDEALRSVYGVDAEGLDDAVRATLPP